MLQVNLPTYAARTYSPHFPANPESHYDPAILRLGGTVGKKPAASIPFEQWRAEKKRSLEMLRDYKIREGLREEIAQDFVRAAERALGQAPDPSPPRAPRRD